MGCAVGPAEYPVRFPNLPAEPACRGSSRPFQGLQVPRTSFKHPRFRASAARFSASRPKHKPRRKLKASNWHLSASDTNPVVQDWKHPVRAPPEKQTRVEPLPNWHRPVWTGPASKQPRAGPSPEIASRAPTPKPKLAPVWSGQVQLADPDPVVQDWKHPVRAASEEN